MRHMTSTDDQPTPTTGDAKFGRGILTLVLLVFIAAAGGIYMTSLLGNL